MEGFKNTFPENQDKLYQTARENVELLVDKLGKGIDEGIKDTIAILNAMNFHTTSSCSGHIEKDSFAIPYVEFYTPAPDGWKMDPDKQALWAKNNLKQQEKLIPLINEFNNRSNRHTHVELKLSRIGIFGGFRLVAEIAGSESSPKIVTEIIKIIEVYQKEILDFTEFLKLRFLNK
jgi:hypothetical protein